MEPLTPHPSRLTVHRPLVAIVGPTAIGKSRIAIHVAEALQTEVLTADSRQVYRGMDIGTDKPAPAERRGIPHRLINLVEPDERFNAGEYRRHALAEIERLHGEGRVPLIVGGTGLYVRALLHGLCPAPPADWEFRGRLLELARVRGPECLHDELTRLDPVLAARLHVRDQAKIIRALEVRHLSGRPLSQAQREHAFRESAFSALVIGLEMARLALYQRIDERVELELEKGLVAETQGLLDRGFGRELGSMKGLGYRQIAGFLAGDYGYEEAVRRLKRDTRRFAKRQLTWFKKEPGIVWLPVGEAESADQVARRIVSEIERFLERLPAAAAQHAIPAAGRAAG
jgi:tRNA dimethylallyltransferase